MADDEVQQVDGTIVRRVNREEIDLESWPTPDEGAMTGEVLTQYLARKEAVRQYLAGASEKAIEALGSISRHQIYRLIYERCLLPHADGRPYGWRGLVPHARVKPFKRKNKVFVDQFGLGAAGAMEAVLDRHPDLRKDFNKRILSSKPNKALAEIKKTRVSHWKWFLGELRALGYEHRREWPFNTESAAYSSVCRYVDKVLASDPKAAANVVGGPDLQKKLLSGDGVDRPVKTIFERVEMDAHKLDGRFCVMIPQVTGGWTPKIIHRLWVIVILEVTSRAVLGYHLSFGREVSKDDVLRMNIL